MHMNVYSYIFAIFYRFWEERIGNARIIGSAFVTFSLVMHMLFLSEIVRSVTTLKKAVSTGYEEVPIFRDAYWLVIIIIILIVFFIYTPERTNRLLKEFEVRYGENLLGNIIRLLFYIIIPTVVGIFLALNRNRTFY